MENKRVSIYLSWSGLVWSGLGSYPLTLFPAVVEKGGRVCAHACEHACVP